MQRRQFLSAFTLSAAATGGFALRPGAARAMSLEPLPAHDRLSAPPVAGALDWDHLATAGAERFRDGAVSRFPADLRGLDGTKVAISGYMMPIQQGPQHRDFLLGGLQFHCPVCMMSDLGRIMAVRAGKPVAYADTPILLRGTLRLLEGEGSPLFYRLDGARLA
jgi:hypothetical protein